MEATAFDDFYRRHYAAVLRFAERRIDPETAQDVCAQTFAITWKRWDQLDDPSLAWLYRVASNVLGNSYRKQTRDARLTAELKQRERQTGQPPVFDDLEAALLELGEKDRAVLRLTYWEGMTATEVAVVVGSTEAAAWKRISRSKQTLRKAIERMSAAHEEAGKEGPHGER